jgi:hypothetical protein
MPGFGRCYAVSAGKSDANCPQCALDVNQSRTYLRAEPAPRPMPEIADLPDPSCHRLLSGAGIAKYQSLDPDLFLHFQARCPPVTAA